MLSKNLDEIGLSDIQQLVVESVPEGKTIEYKRDFYRLDGPVTEFKIKQHEEMLKDISSFANTLGGDLIIGIEEADGKPSNVCGFDVSAGADKLKIRIHELVQQWIEPLVTFSIRSVDHSAGRAVFVIRVARSPIGPHRVIYQGNFGQFWARNSAGTFAMDTHDLRQAFTNSADLEDKIRGVRAERVRAIARGDTPVKLTSAANLICHLIPTDALTAQISLSSQELQDQLVNFPLFDFTSGRSPLINLDGLIVCDNLYSGLPAAGYVRVLRNGIIESVADNITTHNPMDSTKTPYFKHDYVKAVIECVSSYLRAYSVLRVPSPAWCFLSLTGVMSMHIYYPGIERCSNPVDRDTVEIPEVEIPSYSKVDCAAILKPAFDMLWSAAGQKRCLLYDAAGCFRGQF